MGQWDEMAVYVDNMGSAERPGTSSGAFLTAVLAVRRGDYTTAKGGAGVMRVCEPRQRRTARVLIRRLPDRSAGCAEERLLNSQR